MTRTCLAVVLAAGEGTRMRATLPKVLHEIANRSMLAHVLDAVRIAGGTSTAVVIGPDVPTVAAEVTKVSPQAQVFEQRDRRGTAHAVLAARKALEHGADDVLIIFGDTPLIRPQVLEALRRPLAEGAAVAALGFRPADVTGYGRLVVKDGSLVAIREEKDATADERTITLCNGGLMALSGDTALALLDRVSDSNAKQEFYLTDVVEIAMRESLKAVVVEAAEDDVRGINTKVQLAEAEAVMQRRLRIAAMEQGVTMIAPETVFLSTDTRFGRDVLVEPNVVFGPGVSVDDAAVIHAFSHLVGAQVGKGVSVGPYARLRPGTVLGEGARIGNFVEVKAAVIEAGAKANHLSYIGDSRVGAKANVGAGTITCNYDGTNKAKTDIGAGAFIGSNSALVAPLTIGDGAYVGSGSVITKDVPADALAVGRGKQVVKEGWAARQRATQAAAKAKKSQ